MISNKRLIIVFVLFAATFLLIQSTDSVREVTIKKSLSKFPARIGEYEKVSSRNLTESVASLLQVDDYVDYTYKAPDGVSISFYVSYFSAVGVKGGYHSPRNCLPGGGWQIASIEPLLLDIGRNKTTTININAMTIQQGDEEQIVLYWYQNRGRIIASEYWEKIYLVWDALTKRRRDGSFIRIIA
ncbi:exosortase C-terminal domain/associated protein EpsI, partial [Thermodesulfobacteriota bacterium]